MNLSSVTGIINWLVILISYLRFYYGCRRQGIERKDFPYRAPLQPWASWFGAIMLVLIVRACSPFCLLSLLSLLTSAWNRRFSSPTTKSSSPTLGVSRS